MGLESKTVLQCLRPAAMAGLMAVMLAGSGLGQATRTSSGAIGQIVPNAGIVALTGVPGAIVESIRVKAGDPVKAGDLLMTLKSDSLQADQDLAQADLETARNAARSRVATQLLAVDLATRRVKEAARELDAYRALGERATAANEVARLEAAEAEARLSLQMEQSRLSTVRSEAQKAVAAAERGLALARAASELRAPTDGTILKVDRRPGQRLTGEAAIEMGDLSTMYVTCQVFEGDLLMLRPGMKATIRNATLPKPIGGTVEEVSRIVDARSRLGDVRIRLDEPDPANRLVGMEVEVVIAR